jgi:hypothetical protein
MISRVDRLSLLLKVLLRISLKSKSMKALTVGRLKLLARISLTEKVDAIILTAQYYDTHMLPARVMV